MTDAGRRVDGAVDPVNDADGDALRLARRIAETVDDGIFSGRENLSSAIVAILERGRLALDEAAWPVLNVVVEEPRLAQDAGPFGLDDVVILNRKIDVVADAAAERAGGV